jgi:hypothetical protein
MCASLVGLVRAKICLWDLAVSSTRGLKDLLQLCLRTESPLDRGVCETEVCQSLFPVK